MAQPMPKRPTRLLPPSYLQVKVPQQPHAPFQPAPTKVRPRPGLTELAQKYTHPTGDDHSRLQGMEPLKSGLTPLEFASFATIDEYLLYWYLEEYQKDRFNGLFRLFPLLVTNLLTWCQDFRLPTWWLWRHLRRIASMLLI